MKSILKYTKYDLFLILVSLYSVFTLLQSLLPFSMNRIIVIMLCGLLLFENTIRGSKAIMLLYLLAVLVISSVLSNNIMHNLNDYIYFAVALVLLYFFSEEKSWNNMQAAYNRIRNILVTISYFDFIIIIISLCNRVCYTQHWGEDLYFYGFTNSGHTMGSSCCLALSLFILGCLGSKPSIVQLGVIMVESVAILRTGARIFLIPLAVMLFLYLQFQIESKRLRMIMYLIGGLAFGYALMTSNMMAKFIFAITDPDNNSSSLMESFTSGRSKFWVVDLKDFFSSNIFYQLFGHGFTYIYQLNLSKVGMEIWAHNDFINILVSCGYLGLAFYVSNLFATLKAICKGNRRIFQICIVCYALIPAFINGLYTYFHLFLSFVIISLANKITLERR